MYQTVKISDDIWYLVRLLFFNMYCNSIVGNLAAAQEEKRYQKLIVKKI